MNLSKAQADALTMLPAEVTGPWFTVAGWKQGLQTVDQDPIRWQLRNNWTGPLKRLVRKGLAYRSGGNVYHPTASDFERDSSHDG